MNTRAILNRLYADITTPPPEIRVFAPLQGLWLSETIEPTRGQRFYGMSPRLFDGLDARLRSERNERIGDYAKVIAEAHAFARVGIYEEQMVTFPSSVPMYAPLAFVVEVRPAQIGK